MFTYAAYGLGMHSAIELPELVQSNVDQDVWVSLMTSPDISPAHPPTDRVPGSADVAVLRWDNVGTFVVRYGKEIVILPADGVHESWIRGVLLGPVLAMLLRQLRFLVLHASAVAIGHEVMLFMGGSGWGKSTLAAALCRQGARLLSDDVTAIEMTRSRAMVIPGYPQLKLWPDSVRALGQDPEAFPRLHDSRDKRACRTGFDFCSEPLPLARAYVLAEGLGLQVTDLDPQAALVELVRHSARVRDLHPEHAPRHLRQCATLVNSVPIARLTVPPSFEALSDVVAALTGEVLHAAS